MGLPQHPADHPSSAPSAVPPVEAPATEDPQRERRRMLTGWTAGTPVWMQRVSLLVFVVFCIELGILLTVLPWTRVWSENSLLAGYPALRSFLQQGFVRGVVSGLGLIDIWIGVWEAVHYTEVK
jgi:hypothetical protein